MPIVSFSSQVGSTVHKLALNRVDDDVKIIIDGKTIVEDADVAGGMKTFIEQYASNANDKAERDDRTYVWREQYGGEVPLLFRALAATNVFLKYVEDNCTPNTNAFTEHIKEAFRKYCYNRTVSELTGDTGKLMYFLDAESQFGLRSLLDLYESGHLHTIVVEIDGEMLSNYYVPFDHPSHVCIKQPDAREVWLEIVRKSWEVAPGSPLRG